MNNESNNIGAISSLKGYRVQFLYSLYRILSHKESEFEFRPEGRYEDLDIYDENGDVIEIIQVKDYGNTLTLSKILSQKENTFIRRAIKAYKENVTPKIKLVSFGEVNDEVKDLSLNNYTEKMINKLKKLRISQNEIKILQDNFEYEVVNEEKVKEEIISRIIELSLYANSNITLDLLIYWIYYAAEKQKTITLPNFKEQFDKLDKYQGERISFNRTYNNLIRPLDKEFITEDVERLRSDFYQGISSTYKHILANVDVQRIDKLQTIIEGFNKSNIVFIHGASGQGKSTLAYRYLHEYCNKDTVFELKHLPENITKIYEVVNSLEGISKGISFPFTFYMDVEPGNKEWIHILKELASKKNFNFLVTIREEDWNSIEVDDKFQFSELELLLEKEEAELIYSSLENYKADLIYTDFENAWDTFGGDGPLLEFVYQITQNESLSAKLKTQINKIRRDRSTVGKEIIKVLRYIVLADCFGSKIKYKEFAKFLKLDDISYLIELLQKEYLIKISDSKSYITGLHPVRSKIIKGILFDNEQFLESEYAIDSISFISDSTLLLFLKNSFRYTSLSPDALLERLKSFSYSTWQSYLLIFKSLLWKGINDYVEYNIDILNKVYNDYNKGWITIVNFDFANVINGGSLMENSDIFTEEQRQYAIKINKDFSNKNEVFSYCLDWLKSINQINILPIGIDEWDAFASLLFWLDHFNYRKVIINYNDFDIENNLKILPLDIIAHVLYAFKEYNRQSKKFTKKVENIFLQKLSEEFNVISIKQKDNKIICNYFFDIIDEKIDTEESDIIHTKSIKIIDLIRFAFPDKKSYGTKGVGQQFSFLPTGYDSSYKQIPKKKLPLKPLVEINSIYKNLFEFTKRPISWQDYVNITINRRLLINEVMSKMIMAFSLYHKKKHLKPLADYIHEYNEKYHNVLKNEIVPPSLPKLLIDEWGEYDEGSIKRVRSNFGTSTEPKDNNEIRKMIAVKKYDKYVGLYREYDSSLENFLWQSAESIFRKIKISLNENVSEINDYGRVSLVGNLFNSFEVVSEFQKLYRNHFGKFTDPIQLTKIEKEEICNISTLCFQYRHFIYSSSFINGNTPKIAINRFREIELNIKKKVKNGFKQIAKEIDSKIDLEFEEKEKRCIIIANIYNTNDTFQFIEKLYNKLYELLEQPDYTSLKYLILNTKYPVFNIVLLISGKTINSSWYEFKTYNILEKKIEELEQFNLIPQPIPQYYLDKYNFEAWNKNIKEFQNLDKLLESTSMAFQLAFHFSQFKSFENKKIESYSEKILMNHIDKIGLLFQENFQTSIDLLCEYTGMCHSNEMEFVDDTEEIEIYELFDIASKMLYPNDYLYEKRNLNITLNSEILEDWIPRLEQLTNIMGILYYFFAGKIIEKKLMIRKKNISV